MATDFLGLFSFGGDVAGHTLGAELALTAGDLLPDFFLFLYKYKITMITMFRMGCASTCAQVAGNANLAASVLVWLRVSSIHSSGLLK